MLLIKILFGKPEDWTQPDRPTCRCEGNIKNEP